MDVTPFEASEKHREGEIEEAHDMLRDYYDFVYCPWCGIELLEEFKSRGNKDEKEEM